MAVSASSTHTIKSFLINAGVSASAMGAGVSNSTSVALMQSVTEASVDEAAITAKTLDVAADHHGKINTAAIAIGGSGAGAGVGVGVSVLNENSQVKAALTDTDVTYAADAGATNISAGNETDVTYQLYNFGGAVAGVAGSVGVANVNSIVDTTVKNTSLGSAGAAGTQAGSIGVTSSNDIDFNENAGTGAAGAVGIGVGVSVNTIDSQVKTNVENSKLYAQGAVNISAEEKRDVEQLSVNAAAGAIAGGANVMITNVGKEVSAAYGAAGGGNVDVNTIYQEANDAVNGNRLSSEYTLGGMSDTDAEAAAGDGSAGKGGTQESIVKTTVNGATIQAGGKASISAVEETNVAALGINAQAGLAGAVSGAVGILNVHRNSGVELTSADIDAGEVEIKALQKGVSSLQMYQGTVGGYASIGAAYGSVNTEGKGGIGIGNSQITSQENMTITAADQSSTLVDAVGVAIAAGGSASVLVAEGENNGKVTIKSDQSILQAGENLSVTAERKAKDAKGSDTDSLSVRSIAASGGLVFAGAGVAAMANEFGTVGVDITGGSKLSAAKNLTLHANNDPRIKAQTGAVGVSLLASAAVTVAEANIGSEEDEKHLKTYVNVSDGNTFAAGSEKQAGTVEFKAAVNAGQTVDMGAISIGAGSVQVNTGGADVYSDVDVTVGNHTIYTSTDGKRNVDVIMEGSNTTAQDVDANGINVGGLLATGTNLAQSNVHFKTNVQALGASTGSHIGNLSVKGRSYAKIAADAKGYGAALIDISPYAAKVDNNYTADTDVTLKGNWTTAGKVEAQALNGMDIDVTSDAVRAAIVGGSGVWLRNTINNAAHITLDGAIINSGGAQDYLAKNTADYNGNINAGGYGGINVNAADLKDDIDFTAGVTATNGTHLHGTGDSGSVSLRALTAGTINSKNNLKSAGLIPISLAFSDHAIDYSNTVSVEGSSEITTAKKDQNITLSASDDTDVRLQTIADTQGGVVGAASAEAKNTINRGNHIHAAAGSMLESTNDVNLYAGADSSGIQSELGLEVLADAYNKTVLPVFTKPKVTNTMTQQNQVALGGDVSSVRHINAKAGKGVTTVTESAKEYNLYDGTSGSGSVASTALGETIGSETATNYVNVTGTAKSGIHNKLTINIGGSTTTTAPTYKADGTIDKEGSVDYDTITITAADGSDWFDTDSIKIDNLDIVNGMIGRYNEIRDLMQQYNSGSKEYNAYKAEMNLLVLEMKKAGLVALGDKGNQTDIPVSKAVIGAITLPEIVVSGGNINVDADTLKGTGKINAQGAPQLTITNSSDLYVKVNDLTIKDAGGQIKFNGSDLTKGSTGNSFSGNFHADGLSEQVPSITIHGTSPSTFTGNTFAQADIGIVGDITNTTGNVVISNDNYNIVAQGKISGRNITLSAAKGSVTQTSSDGLANIGGDPVTQYQFSEAVAKKIQTFLYKKGQSGTQNFDNYQTYLNWLVNVVGIGLDELGIAPKVDYIQYDNAALVAAIKADYPKYTDQQIQNFIAAKTQNIPAWEGYLTSKKVTWSYNLSSVSEKLVDKSAGIQAGNNVYINAVNVNIGGLVQSGYGSYTTTLNDADKAKVATMDATWAANRRSLSDNEVMTNNAYLVNGGGATWNDKTGVWDYEVKVYYNPSTKQLLTEKIAPDGGKIYITGKISSTGNGRIMAMDGAADIGINTAAVERNVKVNAIANNDITGLISITDKNKNLVTEYKNGETRSYAVGTQTAALPEWSAGNSSYTYNPKSGTQYAWTGGISGSVLKKYQYSEDFLFWGALDYGKTDDFVAGLNRDEKQYTSTPISSSGGSLKEGSLVTDGGNGKKLTISWNYANTTDEKYSEVVADKQYDGFWGKVFGYGTTTYTWTGSQGDKMSSSTGLKADEGIQIGFLGNGNGSGNISVTSKNDMLLAGNISNATILDANSDFIGKGAVNLTSQAGRIDSMGGVLINSDDVRIQAATGVNVNHAAIGSKAAVDVTAAAGDIQFASTKGDLHIKQLITGGTQAITASTGNISLTAEGSILNDASGTYAVKGKRIDFASKTGSIGTKEKAFTVLGGSDLYSSDTMASSVSAKADGDVVLTQTEGNMRLGTIESVSGDAVLTVNNGSFVDAYNDGGSGYSDTDGKVQNWIDNGIISTNDADDSSTHSAAQAKADRLEALEGRAQTLAGGDADKVTAYKDAANAYTSELADTDSDLYKAQQTYQNAVTSITGDSSLDDKTQQAQVQEAYAAYGKAKESYFKSKGFSADEQSLIASYGEVNSSNSYGWSKNQLLYAIQDSVLNSTPGQVTTVDYANVTANNITLHAAKGGVGIDSAAKTIHYGDMTKLENLKVLAASKAGDLTWDDKAGTVTVRQQQAINLNVKNNGQTMVTGRDNVYLAGVKDTTFNITGIETANDIKLMSDNGVYMAGDGVLKGKNLIIYGGDGNIGAADHHVVTEITGALDANSAESVYLTQRDGVLTIQSVAAGKDAVLDAAKGMVMTTVAGKTGGYITAGHQIDLSAAAGALGIDGDGIRINNNKAVVNTASKDNTYLFGKGENGTLLLGSVTSGGKLDVDSEGSVALGREEKRDEGGTVITEAVQGDIHAVGSADITAENNITLGTSGVNVTGENSRVSLTATGSISQDEKAAGIHAVNLALASDRYQKLVSTKNSVSKVTISGRTGNTIANGVSFVSDSGSGLTVGLSDILVTDGNVELTNLAADGALKVTGTVTATHTEGSAAPTDIIMTSEGSLTNADVLDSAGKIHLTAAGDILQQSEVKAGQEVVFQSHTGGITVGDGTPQSGTITAGTFAGLSTQQGNIVINGNVNAGDYVQAVTGSGSIILNGAITGGTFVKASATEGDVAIKGSIKSQNGDTMLTASDANGVDDKGNITVDGTIMSAKDVHAITDDGDILINGNVAADQNVSAQTDTGMIDFGGTVAAQAGNINANVTKAGAIVFSKDASAGTDIQAVNQNGSITFNGTSVAAGRDILARTADKGDIFFKGMSSAGRNITAQTDSNGSITFNGAATAVNTISAAAQQDGGITLRQNITAGNDLDLHTNKGTILFEGNNPAAGEDVIATAQNGNIKITVDTKGDVRDSHRSINGDRAFLRAENGNVTIDHRGVGDVDLYEVYAKDDARISLKDGDLHLGTVNGDLVAILVKNPNKDMDVEHIVAGTEILVSGADMDLEDIEQRLGSDGMLIITPNGASDDVPIDKLHIGNIRTNGGVRFKHLWLNSGDITVSKGNFFLDKLYILDKATFSNGVMKTNIFGTAPQRDESVQNTYWNNTAINNPKEDLENWLSDSRSSKWAYLNFYGQNNVQFSNGHLLDLTDHYHVYRQRYTQADWMRIFTDPDFYNAYETYYHPELSYHDRYGLVDTKYEAGQNASAQELTVEK